MKKSLFTLVAACFLGVALQAQIVITEIMYNPPESGTDSLEFVEVLNNSNTAVNMTDWKLEYGANVFTVPTLTLGANQYQVFSVNASAMQNNFGISSIQWTSGALSNNGTSVKVRNAAAVLIDSVTFDDIAPWPTDPDGLGPSLVLCNPNADNSLAENWIAATTETLVVIGLATVYANPGAASGCPMGLIAEPDGAAVVPGVPFEINVLANDNYPNPITSVSVIVAPSHGTAMVTGNNTIIYTSVVGYCGPDQFTYQICDGPGSCANAVVSIEAKCYPVRTIGEMNNVNPSTGIADSVNVACTITGTVYGINFRASTGGLQFVVMNETGTEGLSVFSDIKNYGYTVSEGDLVALRGTIGQFNGLTQINLDTVSKGLTAALVSPSVVLKADESTENRLVRINNLRIVNSAQWIPGLGSGFTVQVYSPSNPADTIAMRIDNDTDIFNQSVLPGEPFDLIGLGGQFDSSVPFSSGYQIQPRYSSDIISVVGTSLVDYSNEVVIAPNPVRDFVRIQSDVAFDRISILSANGEVVKSLQNPGFAEWVNLSGYAPGVYVVRFEKDGAIFAKPLVKVN